MIENNNAKEKKWILKFEESNDVTVASAKIAAELDIHPIIAKLLYNRGYCDVDSARTFIRMESEMLCDPFEMKDIDKGVERIHSAVKRKEKITVYGDYDVDGVTSVCTLYLYLRSLGANIDYYIPNRSGEGYGVSISAIDAIKETGTSLIITVDTGITAIEEVEYAKKIGVDFVITDHHECREDLPRAVAVINPHRLDCKYPFKELAGVGVVFKLVSACEERICGMSKREAAIRIFTHYADLVAIGTIADVMPIKDENRIIVSYGLKMIENTNRPGITALINASVAKSEAQKNDKRKKRTKITSGYIGYTLAPRINAAGRIRSATLAVELFLASDSDNANRIANELCQANKERQNEENKIMKEAFEKIEKMNIDENPVVVLDADNWHHGVIGIVASRITEKFSRPSILISFDGNDGDTPYELEIGKGSGRSIKGLNLVDALYHCSDHLVKFGGHELAAGLSVSRSEIDNFRKKINEYARSNLKEENMVPTVDADCVITFEDLNINLAQQLQQLEPYGVGNPIPAFILRGAFVNEITSISDGKHTRMVIGDGNVSVTAMYFSNSPESTGIKVGDRIDVLFNLDVNEWLGRRSVQLILKDVKRSLGENEITQLERKRFEEIWNGAFYAPEENIFPIRDDFVKVYQFINNAYRQGTEIISHRDMVARLSRGNDTSKIGYIKLKFIIKILYELNLLGVEELETELYRFSVHYSHNSQKTPLEKSNLLRRLKSQQRKY